MITEFLAMPAMIAVAAFVSGFVLSQVFFSRRKKYAAKGQKIDRLRSELAAADHALMLRGDRIAELERRVRELELAANKPSRRAG